MVQPIFTDKHTNTYHSPAKQAEAAAGAAARAVCAAAYDAACSVAGASPSVGGSCTHTRHTLSSSKMGCK